MMKLRSIRVRLTTRGMASLVPAIAQEMVRTPFVEIPAEMRFNRGRVRPLAGMVNSCTCLSVHGHIGRAVRHLVVGMHVVLPHSNSHGIR
jgi:hypothetical protein